MNQEKQLAERNLAVQWSGIRVMFEHAETIPDVVNLGIGQPDFDTPEFIRQAAKDALDEGWTRYPPSRGFPDLRQAIAEKIQAQNGYVVDPETDIFVAVGAMQVIFNTMLHLLNRGDEVIVVDPGYDYFSQIGLFGGVPVRVPALEENGFKIDPDDLAKAVTNKTKLMIYNSPSNPTGAMFDRECLQAIADLAIKHDFMVLSDEPYEDFVYDGRQHISMASLEGMKERTISAYTLSKSYAMTGWRVGYAVGPRAVMDEMEKLMEHMVSGVPSMIQRAALAAITGPRDCVADMLKKYDQRRRLVFEGLNRIEGVSCLMPESTFYAFPNFKRFGKTSWDLAEYLVKEHRVALVPGSSFGQNGEGYLRLSYAAPTAVLREGLARIERGARQIL